MDPTNYYHTRDHSHKSVLIFLHDLNETPSKWMEYFAEQEYYSLAPLDCRIILPCADKIETDLNRDNLEYTTKPGWFRSF